MWTHEMYRCFRVWEVPEITTTFLCVCVSCTIWCLYIKTNVGHIAFGLLDTCDAYFAGLFLLPYTEWPPFTPFLSTMACFIVIGDKNVPEFIIYELIEVEEEIQCTHIID